MKKETKEWAKYLTTCAGKSEADAERFLQRLERYPEVGAELEYYFEHRDFQCAIQVNGFSIVDLLVWQVDHFKAYMDRPDEMNRYDQDRLVWSAFDTMLEMCEQPEKISVKLKEQTGTDFEGKHFII